MPVKYDKATSEVAKIVRRIRRKYYHKFYKDAKIVTLMRSGGRWDKWGQIRRVTGEFRKAGIEADYILLLNGDEWPQFTLKQKRALVDHELAHMKFKLDKQGNIQYRLRHHDVEEFVSIVKRYGAWSPALKKFRKLLVTGDR